MKKSLNELLTYIWIPFILGFAFYIVQDLNDIILGVVTLLAFSAIYALVRIYFSHKKWQLLAGAALVAAAAITFFFVRPQEITLSINNQPVTGASLTLSEGTVSVSPAPDGKGKYIEGTTVTITYSPAAGYDWKSWESTDKDANPTTVTLDSPKQVTLTFDSRPALIINNQTVIGSVVSFAEGSVFIDPTPGEDGKYARGEKVSLTAKPNPGYDWQTWTGTEGNSTNPTTVTMNGRKQISVLFESRASLIINNQVASDSTMSFAEGSVTVNPPPGGDDKYARGTVITLTANPDLAYGLKNWAGTASDTTNPTTVTINSDKHVTVIFELRFPLAVNNQQVSGSSANLTEGTVSISQAPKADGRYAKDTTVTLTASPATGYRFDKWSGDASGNATSTTITINSAKNITASFKRTYTLSVSANAAEGSVAGGGVYDEGTIVTLTAAPAAGYRFDKWSGDASGNATSVSITMNADKNATASFRKVYPLTITISPSNGGSVSPAGGNYDAGSSITLTAIPASGYRFDKWDGDASGNTTSANITMTSGKNVTAVFKPNP